MPPDLDLPTFISHSSHSITGRGISFITRLDRDCRNFKHLRGKLVNIDGEVYTCISTHMGMDGGFPPWRKGQEIGLIVVEG